MHVRSSAPIVTANRPTAVASVVFPLVRVSGPVAAWTAGDDGSDLPIRDQSARSFPVQAQARGPVGDVRYELPLGLTQLKSPRDPQRSGTYSLRRQTPTLAGCQTPASAVTRRSETPAR